MKTINKQLKQSVFKYRNEAVTDRIKKDLKLSFTEAEQLFKDMLKFLYIASTSGTKPVSPPKLIDEAWHTFIIYTRDYADFCQKYFGKFIHHRPNRPGEKHGHEGGQNCIMFAMEFFGKDLSKNWGIPKDELCGHCADKPCKSCDTCSSDTPQCCSCDTI